MNAKEAKGLRQSLRSAGVDPKVCNYNLSRNPKDPTITGTVYLDTRCGRYQYKQLKKGATA